MEIIVETIVNNIPYKIFIIFVYIFLRKWKEYALPICI